MLHACNTDCDFLSSNRYQETHPQINQVPTTAYYQEIRLLKSISEVGSELFIAWNIKLRCRLSPSFSLMSNLDNKVTTINLIS